MKDFFTWKYMLISSWPILSVLLCCSIFSVMIMWERWTKFRRAALDSKVFVPSMKKLILHNEEAKAIAYCGSIDKPLSNLVKAILTADATREEKEKAARQSIMIEMGKLEAYVPILGTVGSIAPFIGLFGTVIGIIKAFKAISTSVTGGPQVVAGGIAEALVNTAFGLFVAIPAVVAYNYFVSKTRRINDQLIIDAEEIIDTVLKKHLPSPALKDTQIYR